MQVYCDMFISVLIGNYYPCLLFFLLKDMLISPLILMGCVNTFERLG